MGLVLASKMVPGAELRVHFKREGCAGQGVSRENEGI